MNKNLLALAVSVAVLAPAAASADAKIYGVVQAEYSVEDSSAAGVNSVQGVDDDNGQSRLGFKANEKLGGGLSAFAQVEFGFDPADHSTNGVNDSVNGRVQFMGLKGSWGTFTVGTFDAPYKVAGGVKWDPFAATHLQARRAGGMSGGAGIGGHNGYMTNAMMYTSPKVNGFQVKFAISPDETNVAATANDSDASDNDYSLSVNYNNGPWQAIFAHNRNNAVTGADDETLTKVGLRWKNGPWSVAGQYEDINDAIRSVGGAVGGSVAGAYTVCAGCDANILWLNANYKAGNNTFSVAYGDTDVDNTVANADFDYDMWTVGVRHSFSKKTSVFGGYTQTDGDNNGNAADRDAWSVGIRQKF